MKNSIIYIEKFNIHNVYRIVGSKKSIIDIVTETSFEKLGLWRDPGWVSNFKNIFGQIHGLKFEKIIKPGFL